MSKRDKKVLVAMSGGVDSSVAAALLKRAGFDVIGAFMKLWKPEIEGKVRENNCCSPGDERRARKVAHVLNIPFYDFNFEREFKHRVVDYFLKEYRAGRTPNPCVVCNNQIKFGLLLEKALALDVDFLATGHYARLRRNSEVEVHQAKDESKDQTYFLWQLGRNQLNRILFPVGDYNKSEVEKLAQDFNLPVEFTESHEVCFVPNELDEFLKQYLPVEPGKIVSVEGEQLGEHQGLHFFTRGQRKGLGLSQGPWYVVEKKIEDNELVVTRDRERLEQTELIAEDINWVSGAPELPLEVKAKIRYNSPAEEAELEGASQLKVTFERPQWAIAPGQSVVFYSNSQLLGGGIIQ